MVTGVGCGVVGSAVLLGLSRGIVWVSGVDGGLSDWRRAGRCWRFRWYWSSRSEDGSVAGGSGGAAEVSGVLGALSVVVRSIVGLLGEVVLVSIVLMLSMVVSGLSFGSVAVVASAELSESGSWLWGSSGQSCSVGWLYGTVLAVLC